jgi:ADP-ribose pyrophosphatase
MLTYSGFCNTNLNVVHISVDMRDPHNQNPTPQLEEDEFIECFSVPLTDLYAEYRNLASQGFGIDARVGTLAEGIELARRWSLFGANLTHVVVPESV